jgi:hypothetical protein
LVGFDIGDADFEVPHAVGARMAFEAGAAGVFADAGAGAADSGIACGENVVATKAKL